MKGYPSHLNSREDYEYVRENFPPEKWKPDWENLLMTEYDWVPVETLPSKADGIIDDTHKVIESFNDITGEVTYVQMEYAIIPTCKLLDLGFTHEYVAAVLAEN